MNVLITLNDITNVLRSIDKSLTPKNLTLYQIAFVHESYYQEIQNMVVSGGDTESRIVSFIPYESNERLEFLGDNILKSIIGSYLYKRFPSEREGFLTKTKIRIEKSNTLHLFGRELSFNKYILLASQVEAQTITGPDKGRNAVNLYECAFEAFVGALFMDLGYIDTERFVIGVIERYIDFSDILSTNDNYKDSLQRFFQSRKWGNPRYYTLGLKHKSHLDKTFVRAVYITDVQLRELECMHKGISDVLLGLTKSVYCDYLSDNNTAPGIMFGVGKGKRIIDAEQDCARDCMTHLGV